jgi:hypothetical protein
MVTSAPESGSQRRRARTWLFNPFHYLAGVRALALGVVCILTTGLVGAWGRSHFDGVLDFHVGASAPVWIFLAEGIIAWLTLSVLLAATGKLVSRTHVRSVDVFGTQALARAPMLLTAIAALLPGYGRFASALMLMQAKLTSWGIPKPHFDVADAAAFGIVILVTLTMLVWMVALMYRAYAVSCNVKGGRAVISFIVALVLAEAASKTTLYVIFRAFVPTA